MPPQHDVHERASDSAVAVGERMNRLELPCPMAACTIRRRAPRSRIFILSCVTYASGWWNNKSSPASADALRLTGHLTINVVLATK